MLGVVRWSAGVRDLRETVGDEAGDSGELGVLGWMMAGHRFLWPVFHETLDHRSGGGELLDPALEWLAPRLHVAEALEDAAERLEFEADVTSAQRPQ